ncbi:MAG: hypothetical protein RL617_118 [Pseudomonadota bacterium]
MPQRLLLTLGSALFIAMIGLPLLAVLAIGLSAIGEPSALDWLSQTVLPLYLVNSLLLCLGTLLVAFLLGLPPAWFVTQYEFALRRVVEWSLIIPMAMPAYVISYAYTDALDYSGWLSVMVRTEWLGMEGSAGRSWWPEIRSLPGACLVLGAALSPYVALLAKSAFEDRQLNLAEAARSLGLSSLQAYYRVVLPLARPALVAGAALVLMECLADYGTVAFFSVQTLSTGLFKTWFGYGDRNAAALLGLLMLVLAVALLEAERQGRGSSSYVSKPGANRPRLPLQGAARVWVPFVSLLGGALGFVVPTLLLVHAAMTGAEPIEWGRLVSQSAQTAMYGAYGIAVIVPIAFLLAYAQRLGGLGWSSAALRMAASGYAVPGLVVAVGLLGWSMLFTQWAYVFFDWRVTLTTTIVLLLGGYLTRFFTVGFAAIEVSLGRITESLDWSARSLGLSPRAVLLRVHLPIMQRGAWVASLLVFVDIVKELPLTLVLRPMNVETLATAAHHFASDERLADAAAPSLAIALVGLLPLLILGPRLR